MIILIPAYEPDKCLLKLIKELHEKTSYKIVIVDDGSGPQFKSIFENAKNMGCTILTHKTNRGKGRALKTGFTHILNENIDKTDVVTVDADGQHLVDDIIKVAQATYFFQDKIVLGVRKFNDSVPLRSTVGNTITRAVFTFVSGENVTDTQTGLRGFPLTMLPWLINLEGERFEYEMNMLLKAHSAGYEFRQIEIETVYLAGNRSSHFRTIRDSVLVYFPFLKFSISGILSAFVDYTLFFVFQWITNNLFISVVEARVISSIVNFTINRSLVFTIVKKQKTFSQIVFYYTFVCILLMLNYLLLQFLSRDLKISLFWSKVITEITLFSLSFAVQHLFIFRKAVHL